MGILDGIVEWIAEQVMNGLDIINTSVLGALGCNMDTFKRYFPAAETMYKIFVALAIGLILLNWVWQLFKNYGLSAGIEAEDPVKLSIRSILFILLANFAYHVSQFGLGERTGNLHNIMESLVQEVNLKIKRPWQRARRISIRPFTCSGPLMFPGTGHIQ